MTIPDNYDDVIQPALARFCGWRLAQIPGAEYWLAPDETTYGGRTLPDPLRDPADAWALMCALLRARPTLHLNSSTVCDWFSVYSLSPPLVEREGRGDTPALALVLAAWAVVQGMEKGEEE